MNTWVKTSFLVGGGGLPFISYWKKSQYIKYNIHLTEIMILLLFFFLFLEKSIFGHGEITLLEPS